MSIVSEILGRRMRLIEPLHRAITHEPDLPVEADDGAVLLTDRWVATASLGRPQPTVLVRSPYGRRGFVGLMFGRLLAERGLQVVVQSVRGTFGSGGTFAPFDERADGLATLRWLRGQPWHTDRVGTFGPSYLGLVQWALAADAGDELVAMSIGVSASQFYDQTYAGGGMSLETAASWMAVMTAQESRLAPLAINRALRRLTTPMSGLPLGDLDQRATGAVVPWYREALDHPEREDAYWTERDFSGRVSDVTAPVSFVGGWYDIFLPWMLADHAALQAAGRRPQLAIGPWAHTSPGLAAAGHREGIAWLRAELLDDPRLVRESPVRIRVTGEVAGGGWRDLPAWPPPGTGDSDHFDLFVRVCDVDPEGVSRNVCDALARVAPGRFARDGDGVWDAGFALWPLGHRFAAGHRIRLQVSSGAHPRYARNPGTGEDPMTAVRLQAVTVALHHGARHPSALILPAAG